MYMEIVYVRFDKCVSACWIWYRLFITVPLFKEEEEEDKEKKRMRKRGGKDNV